LRDFLEERYGSPPFVKIMFFSCQDHVLQRSLCVALAHGAASNTNIFSAKMTKAKAAQAAIEMSL
jgi:hypothetical protein